MIGADLGERWVKQLRAAFEDLTANLLRISRQLGSEVPKFRPEYTGPAARSEAFWEEFGLTYWGDEAREQVLSEQRACEPELAGTPDHTLALLFEDLIAVRAGDLFYAEAVEQKETWREQQFPGGKYLMGSGDITKTELYKRRKRLKEQQRMAESAATARYGSELQVAAFDALEKKHRGTFTYKLATQWAEAIGIIGWLR